VWSGMTLKTVAVHHDVKLFPFVAVEAQSHSFGDVDKNETGELV